MKISKVWKVALFPVGILILAAAILLIERMGISYQAQANHDSFLPQSVISAKKDNRELEKESLMLIDSSVDYTEEFYTQMGYVLDCASVGYDVVDVKKQAIPAFTKYKNVVLVIPDFTAIIPKMQELFSWIENGGRMFVLCPVEPTPAVRTVLYQLGVIDMSNDYTTFHGLEFKTDFMVGSKGFSFDWDKNDGVYALTLLLSPDTITHVVSNTGIPLLWEKNCGKGRIVVNHLGLTGKETRGYFMAAYSLLDDAFAYPVINSSVFFIDDFPAPVPAGSNEYIQKFYHRDTESFFTNIWWPDMMNMAKQYELKYTGLLIETYDDNINLPFDRNRVTSRYSYFGNMLLNMGGEIGYHGYNHQPLCLDGFDFLGKVDYNTWPNINAMTSAFDELVSFGKELFPKNTFNTYVPPSNILSPEGEKALLENYPQIKVISGVYIKEDYEYEQEYGIGSNGIINVPRIISGTSITGYDKWLAFNELTFHYANSHFFHPDDVMDPERGAEKGWNKMFSQFNEYISWLNDVAPSMKKCTASEAAKAVERYDTIRLKRTVEQDKLRIDIDNFYDSASIMVRIREGKPGTVQGGTMEQVSTGLYLLKATSANVEIKIVR